MQSNILKLNCNKTLLSNRAILLSNDDKTGGGGGTSGAKWTSRSKEIVQVCLGGYCEKSTIIEYACSHHK